MRCRQTDRFDHLFGAAAELVGHARAGARGQWAAVYSEAGGSATNKAGVAPSLLHVLDLSLLHPHLSLPVLVLSLLFHDLSLLYLDHSLLYLDLLLLYPEVSLPFLDLSLPFLDLTLPFLDLSLPFLDLPLPFLDLSLPFLDLSLPFLDLSLPFPDLLLTVSFANCRPFRYSSTVSLTARQVRLAGWPGSSSSSRYAPRPFPHDTTETMERHAG